MKLAHKLALAALTLGSTVLAGDPNLDYWIYNTDHRTGLSSDRDVWLSIYTIEADVTAIHYDSLSMYISSNSMPSYSIGPWANPNVPRAQNMIYKFPRSAYTHAATGTHTVVGLDIAGVFLNGVAVYGAQADNKISMRPVPSPYHVDAMVTEGPSMDSAMGHSTPAPDYRYHHHCMSMALCDQLGGDHGHCHSPLLGFARDGYPIYGPYGYSKRLDATSAAVRMESDYQLKTSRAAGGPPTTGATGWAMGSFVEDYEVSTMHVITGDDRYLDEYNGRLCVTPEYPYPGTYAYFMTVDSAGNPKYPYILGPNYYGSATGNIVTSLPPTYSTKTPSHSFPRAAICCQPVDQSACRGGSASLEMDVRYGETVRYHWWRSGVGYISDGRAAWGSTIAGSTADTLTFSNLSPRDEGTYACIFTDPWGSQVTSWARISVRVGDTDCDGDDDSTDLSRFISWYTAHDPRADVDDGSGTGTADGLFNTSDLNFFMSRWTTGS